ncbi:hypothetical protein B296_00019691, partial [Ensete ventricosum]
NAAVFCALEEYTNSGDVKRTFCGTILIVILLSSLVVASAAAVAVVLNELVVIAVTVTLPLPGGISHTASFQEGVRNRK